MCEHNGVPGTVITCCATHSAVTGIEVWTWAATRPSAACPCVEADRFVVADETAAPAWSRRADVIVARARPTPRVARRVAAQLHQPPGCPLVVVPVTGGQVVLRDRHDLVLVAGACGICLYPWLAGGGRLSELTGPSSGEAG